MMLNGTDLKVDVGAMSPLHPIQASTERADEIRKNILMWAIIDVSLMLIIFSGNTLTILAIGLSRRIRSLTSNLFILSLAISDVLVGTTLPYHLAFYMCNTTLGSFHTWCLLRFFLIIIACTVSIWNLIAIAVDRYIAIVYPLHYVRYITRKVALIVILMGWVTGVTIGVVPMFWNNWATAEECEFDEILPPWYMAGIVTPLFATVWICMLVLYAKIWHEASRHAKQLRSSFSGLNDGSFSDWKSLQLVLLILGCFSICWLPYFIVACAQIFKIMDNSSPNLYKAAFSMAIANSGMNPIIYAWKNSTFRQAFGRLLRCRSPDYRQCMSHIDPATIVPRRSCTAAEVNNSSNEPSPTMATLSQSFCNRDNTVAVPITSDTRFMKSDDHRPSQLSHAHSLCLRSLCNAVLAVPDSGIKNTERADSNGNRIVNIVENHENPDGYLCATVMAVRIQVARYGGVVAATAVGDSVANESMRPRDV